MVVTSPYDYPLFRSRNEYIYRRVIGELDLKELFRRKNTALSHRTQDVPVLCGYPSIIPTYGFSGMNDILLKLIFGKGKNHCISRAVLL